MTYASGFGYIFYMLLLSLACDVEFCFTLLSRFGIDCTGVGVGGWELAY